MSIEKFSGSFSKEKLGVTILPTKTIQFLKDETLMLWVYLASKHDDWEPNQKEIQTHFGWGERKTRNLFKKLTVLGLLVIKQSRQQGRFRNIHYHLNLTLIDPVNIDLSPPVSLPPVVNRRSVSAVHTKHREQNIELTKKTLCPSQAIDAKVAKKKGIEYPEDFLIFWAMYPRKDGKWPAFKKWDAIKDNQNKIDLMANLERILPELKDRPKSKIKLPETYINKKPWIDEEDAREEQQAVDKDFEAKLKAYDNLCKGN